MLCMADPDPTDWSHFDPSKFHYQDNYYYPPQYSSFGAYNSQSSSNPFDPTQTTTTATPSPTPTVTSPSGSSSGRRHPVYHGIRYRAGKWVSEIREPRKSNRIWLGTYPTPEMAAAAYDVAALALKGSDASLNFDDSVLPNTIPRSPTPADIRVAAANAAAARAPQPEVLFPPPGHDHDDVSQQTGGYVDEDELFDMPNLLREMAEGMMLSPPGIPSDDSPEKMDGDNFWNYP